MAKDQRERDWELAQSLEGSKVSELTTEQRALYDKLRKRYGSDLVWTWGECKTEAYYVNHPFWKRADILQTMTDDYIFACE